MRRALLIGCVGFLLGAACNTNNINTPVRVFDRPSDVALGCVRANPTANRVYDVHPISDCTPDAVGSETVPGFAAFPGVDINNNAFFADGNPFFYFPILRALVANSARGELALVDVDRATIVDLNYPIPGFGFLPVGRLPEHVRASADGCKAVTSNADSCDLGFVDLAKLNNISRVSTVLADPHLPADSGYRDPTFGNDVVRRLAPTVHGVPLGARPRWVEMAPESTTALRGYEPGGRPGECLPQPVVGGAGGYRAWVALPGCQLVAEVDLSATDVNSYGVIPAEVVHAIVVTPAGASEVDPSTVTCPDECDGSTAPGAPPAPDGGARLPTSQALPGTLAIDHEASSDTGRLIIGDLVGERVDIFPIDAHTGALGPARAVQLETGALGVATVRVSPRGASGKFLYAIARDATVRVVDLDREVECETNPDPRALQALPDVNPAPTARQLGCLPLGAPTTPRRSSLALTPGITLPGGALPRDVAFVHLEAPLSVLSNVSPPVAGPSTLVGDYAWIVSSDGRGTLVNIYDACPAPNSPQLLPNNTYTPACELKTAAQTSREQAINYNGNPRPLELDRISHRVRAGSSRFFLPTNAADNSGMARIQDPSNPFTLAVAGVTVLAGATDAGVASRPTMAAGQVLDLDGQPLHDPTNTSLLVTQYVRFIDPDRARNETWNISWEGVLPGTGRTLGNVGAASDLDDKMIVAPLLFDAGGAFCSRGALRGDKLVLVGCTVDTDCDYLQSCAHDPAAPADVPSGLCLARDTATVLQRDLITACGQLLRMPRRYRITSAKQGAPITAADDASGISDVLTLAEAFEPEHGNETHACTTDADCSDITIPDEAAPTMPLPTRCLLDWDQTRRCLRECTPVPSGPSVDLGVLDGGVDPVVAGRCGHDFQCVQTRYSDAPFRCARAPLPTKDLISKCLSEKQPYQVVVGDSFLAVGSATGALIDVQADPATRECGVPQMSSEYTRLHQARIPAEAPACVLADPLAPLDPSSGTNACTVAPLVPPAPSPSPMPVGEHVVHYENPYFAIALRLPGQHPTIEDQFVVSFTLVGGAFALGVALAVDVQAQQPRSAVTGPDQQTVFVVDEGKQTVATGLRGQLLKILTSIVQVDRRFLIR